MQEKELLHGLLEYLIQQADEPDIEKMVLPGTAINPRMLENLPGVRIDPTQGEQDIWIDIKRLSPTKPPVPEQHELARYLRIGDNPKNVPEIDRDGFIGHLEVTLQDSEEAVKKSRLENGLREIEAILSRYMPRWKKWSQSELLVRRSIDLFDTLFSWNVGLTASTEKAQELVAGIALMGWKLPDTGHDYAYPLITVPLELSITSTGSIQICPRDANPALEFDAFLHQESISNAGHIRDNVKQLLQDGRKISPFDETTFSDIVSTVAHNISSRSEINDSLENVTPETTATFTNAWRVFIRPRSASVLKDDILRLQEEVRNAEVLPEQPVSLVTKPSNQAKEDVSITFRGRSGTEGSGGAIQELYFPLPYNREQITIIDQLSKSPGVVVQGPPGTGKTHTIANIICHYLAQGKRVLVTAEKAHALKTVQEKIPEKVRPLVVSRVGTEQEGRAQLQGSIDAILQELSQLKPAIVSENINNAKSQIDKAHAEMIKIDRKIATIANAHLSEFDIDGERQRAENMADLIINGRSIHCWFDDSLTLDPKHAPPIDQEEFIQLKSARRAVGSNLKYLNTKLPSSAKLPDVQKFSELHQILQRVRQLEDAEKNGKAWSLRSGLNESLPQIKSLMADALNAHRQLVSFEDASKDKSWMRSLRHTLKVPNYGTERIALERLLPELQELAASRGEFMEKPVLAPAEVLSNQNVIEAIKRGAETGKPLGWMASLMSGETKVNLSKISVSGRFDLSQSDWQWVLKFVHLRDKCQSVFTRWNQFAGLLGMPALETGDSEISAQLKTIESLCRDVMLVQQIAFSIDGSLDNSASQLFTDFSRNSFTYSSEGLSSFIDQLKNHLAKAELSYARVELSALQEVLAGSSGEVSTGIKAIVRELGTVTQVQDIVARYADLLKEVKALESLSPQFESICSIAAKFENAGASRFARRILTIPAPDNGDDQILPHTWQVAWTWARVKTFLDDINDRSGLIELSKERAEIEKRLSRLYEDVSTKQAWLSLKTSVSDKVTTALNRYKTAIQKIGKGTGKGAWRYRKDAQDAMVDAAEAIPCWVMTHFQVSETMPSKLGLFDLIIVDEASQSTIDAIPVLMRGKKILVVGDDKQVSPSNVGLSVERIQLLRDKYLRGQPHATVLTPEMSLYDMSMAIYASNVMLLEHFRCHPAIISYSNKNFYSDKIRPLRISKLSERIDPPLVRIYTPEGVRGKDKGRAINRIEAMAIVAELGSILADPRYAKRTIGVISLLGPAQAEYIQKLAFDSLNPVELSKRQFACGEPSSFQGAERDIIFMSMVATPEDCHALTRRDHEQRFNVAASRARERMYLVHSVTLDHLSPVDIRCNLLNHFSNPEMVDYSSLEILNEKCESAFEKDVLTELFNLGYRVTPQVKAGAFRIDMVVEGEGDSRLAIECDGDSYHGPEQWPADIARQRALERAGWTFWRCFASTWKLEKQDCISDLVATLKKMGIQPNQGLRKAIMQTEAREWFTPNVDESGSNNSNGYDSISFTAPSSASGDEHIDWMAPVEKKATVPSGIVLIASSQIEYGGETEPESTLNTGVAADILTQVRAVLAGAPYYVVDNRMKSGALWITAASEDTKPLEQLLEIGFSRSERGYWIK